MANPVKKFYSLFVIIAAVVAFGAYQTINIGTNPNDGTGDTLRGAFTKVNANFTQVTVDFVAATNFPGYGLWVTNRQSAVFWTNAVMSFPQFGNTYDFDGRNMIVNGDVLWQATAGGTFNGLTASGSLTVFADPDMAASDASLILIANAAPTTVKNPFLWAVDGSGNTVSEIDTNGVNRAVNFVHTTWKWVDMLVSGDSVASNPSGSPPTLTEIPGQNYFGYAYYWLNGTSGDRSYFTIQSPHKFAATNASNPAFYFEPHCHIFCTNMPAGLSNATFRIDIYYGRVWGQLTNYFVTTNTVAFTNIYQHAVLDFGNVTNNLLSGRASVIFHGRIMRLPTVGDGGLGNNNPVWVESIDIHVPVTELGTTGQFGDN